MVENHYLVLKNKDRRKKKQTNHTNPQPKGRKMLEAVKTNTKLHTVDEVSSVLVGLD